MCVFRSVVQVCCAGEGPVGGEGGRGQNIFGSGMLTTKYPEAVSGTNSNKSFSKGTVVNSRGFFLFSFFFGNCLFFFRETKGTFSQWPTNGSLDKEKKKKEQRKQNHFSYFGISKFSISIRPKTFDQIPVSTITHKTANPSDCFDL